MTGNEVINIKAIQILWDFSVVIWLIYIEDKTTEIKLWSIFESHTPIMYTADKWKSLAYDSFICEVISSVHTDGVCEDCDKRLPLEEQGFSKSYVTISPMGENMNILVSTPLPKSKPNHKPFTVLYSGLIFNVFIAFVFSSPLYSSW